MSCAIANRFRIACSIFSRNISSRKNTRTFQNFKSRTRTTTTTPSQLLLPLWERRRLKYLLSSLDTLTQASRRPAATSFGNAVASTSVPCRRSRKKPQSSASSLSSTRSSWTASRRPASGALLSTSRSGGNYRFTLDFSPDLIDMHVCLDSRLRSSITLSST